MESLVTIEEGPRVQYTLLTPGTHLPRTGPTYQVQADWRDIPDIIRDAEASEILAVDFETRGSDYSIVSGPPTPGETRGGDYSAEISIVGVGLAWDTGSVYLDWSSLYPSNRAEIGRLLTSHPGLVAHNVYFDGGVALTQLGAHPQWKACTYALLASLANESPEQRWGLKHIMTSLLGWESSNDTDLDEWLVQNGYYTGNRRINNSPEYLLSEFHLGKLRPDKGEMWRAPREILGKYCALDAEACYLLYTKILRPVAERFPGLLAHHKECLHSIRIHIEQKILGIPIDRPGLEKRRETVWREAGDLESSFRQHPEVLGHLREIETDLRRELLEREPTRHRKNGSESKNWINWSSRVEAAQSGRIPEYCFNLNSDPQLRKLFYGLLGHPALLTTESGQPSTSNRALGKLGVAGQILADYNYAQKELGFLDGYLEMTQHRGTIHPSFRMPGTVTGRLSSRGPNMQQIPKSKAMMSLFQARPGMVWVDIDFSALEPVVATEFSQDENMLQIYGDGKPANDIYIFVMAHIPGMAERSRALGYNPYNPTPESLARVKKEMKRERGICKTVVLACQYGAGVRKILQTLEADGVILSFEEVATIHEGYWSLFAKLKDFGKSLEYEWRRNKGYILNGLGRPMAVSEDYRKDLLNRFIQSTGHDLLVKYICTLTRRLTESGINWKPIILDWHDSTCVEVPEAQVESAVPLFQQSMDLLNQELSGTISLRGTAVVGRTLAETKEPES